MVSRHSHCDSNRLREFLNSPFTEDGGGDLAEHLEHCEKCRSELEAMAGGRWWNDVRPYVQPANKENAELSTRLTAGANADDPDLSFLSPPDEPEHLGRFGPYQVLDVLGKGGMGVVLRARDPALGRIVAIKVLSPLLATSGSSRQRFEREARAAAAVVHHHVVAIYHVDTDKASGLPYLVMPCIVGRSLQERIDKDGPLDVPAVLRIGMQAASGLAAAHAQGIVHRDIKPANILLENGIERVVLTDFSLARAVDDASLTQSGVIAGTPQYMSPEQTRGEPADHRSDLFSLGSVLYAMCAGRSPFRANSTLAVLRRVSDEQPRPIRELNPAVPEALAAVIEKLHEKEPADRYQSAAEVAAVLSQILTDLQKPGRRVSERPSPRAKAMPRRKHWHPALVAGLILMVFGCAIALFSKTRHPDSMQRFAAWSEDKQAADDDVQSAQEEVRLAHESVRRAHEHKRLALERARSRGMEAMQQAQEECDDNIRDAESNVRDAEQKVREAVQKVQELARMAQVQVQVRPRLLYGAGVARGAGDGADPPIPPCPDCPPLPPVIDLALGAIVKLDPPDGFTFQVNFGDGTEPIVASGKVETRDYDLKDFRTIDVNGPFVVELKQNKNFKVSVTTSDNIFEHLRVEKDGKELKVGFNKEKNLSIHINNRDNPLKVAISLPELDGLKLNGAATATADGFKANHPVVLKLNGASRLTGSLQGNELSVDANGASQLKLAGSGKNLRLKVNGASQLKLADFAASGERLIINAVGASQVSLKGSVTAGVLTANRSSLLNLRNITLAAADVTAIGSSHATVHVTEKLDYSVIGASHLEYYGNPKVDRAENHGASHVVSHKQ